MTERIPRRSTWLAQQTLASRRYFVVMTFLGIAAFAVGAVQPEWSSTPWTSVGGWVLLTVFAGFSTALQLRKMVDGTASVTMRDVWALSALFLWGLPAALIVNLIAVLWSETITKTLLERRHIVLARCAFNASFTSVALLVAWAIVRGADANLFLWLLGGFAFELITIVAVELHVVLNGTRGRAVQTLLMLIALCLIEVPLAAALAVIWPENGPLAVILAIPIFAAAAGVQYVLEFIELRDLVQTDSRTGLLTPPAWRDAAERILRTDQVAILMGDLDHFKVVNDTLGHLAGDRVLEQVGDILTSSIRPSDLACRWGGEEFVLVLTGSDVLEAVPIAERIRNRIADEVTTDGAPLTISIGVTACLPVTAGLVGPALTAALSRADTALYQAKRDGRNQVVAADAARH